MKPLRSTAPATSILSPEFRYVPAAQTDIRETFRLAEQRKTDAAFTELAAAELALRNLVVRGRT
jgi:hypothetical protein